VAFTKRIAGQGTVDLKGGFEDLEGFVLAVVEKTGYRAQTLQVLFIGESIVKKKVLQREIMPLWNEANLALKSITNDIPHDDRDTIQTSYNNDALWCFSNNETTRDIYAHIEGSYNSGKFIK
jgi:hypothetical protein